MSILCRLPASRYRAEKQSMDVAWPWFLCFVCLGQNQCQLAQLALAPPRHQSCLSKRILLPNFLCCVAQASRCVLSVPFPKLADNRTVAAPPAFTGCSLWKRKSSPKLPLPVHTSTATPSVAVTTWGGGFLWC